MLRPLTVADEHQALQAHEELARDGFDFLLDLRDGDSWDEYLQRLECYRRGLDLPDGYVPATFLVADVGGEVVGRVSIRHELNAWLAEVGGHIGYGVRPAFRRRGYATEILRQSLAVDPRGRRRPSAGDLRRRQRRLRDRDRAVRRAAGVGRPWARRVAGQAALLGRPVLTTAKAPGR